MKRATLTLTLFLLGAVPASAQIHFCVGHIDDKGVLHLREFSNTSSRTDEVEGAELDKEGRPVKVKVKVTHQALSERVLEFDASAVKGFDGAGKSIAAEDLVKRLGKDTPVLVLDGGQKPTPALTATLKKETVVLAVPFSFIALGARPTGPVGSAPVPTPLPAPTPVPLVPPPPPR